MLLECTQSHRIAAPTRAAKPRLLPPSVPRSLAAGGRPGQQPASCPLNEERASAAGPWRAGGDGHRRGTSRWCSRTWNVLPGCWGFALQWLWVYGTVTSRLCRRPAGGARRRTWTHSVLFCVKDLRTKPTWLRSECWDKRAVHNQCLNSQRSWLLRARSPGCSHTHTQSGGNAAQLPPCATGLFLPKHTYYTSFCIVPTTSFMVRIARM